MICLGFSGKMDECSCCGDEEEEALGQGKIEVVGEWQFLDSQR